LFFLYFVLFLIHLIYLYMFFLIGLRPWRRLYGIGRGDIYINRFTYIYISM
jgi:hypothetical protein